MGNAFSDLLAGDTFTMAGPPTNDFIVDDTGPSTGFSDTFSGFLNGTSFTENFIDTFELEDRNTGILYTCYEIEIGGTLYYIFDGARPPPGGDMEVANQANPATVTFTDLDSDDEVVAAGSGATNADDTIQVGDGDDSVRGRGGNDSIDGGDGSDTLFGNNGDDTILGGAGGDSIEAGGGNDSVEGGEGADTIDGASGTDTILGGGGADSIRGQGNNDSLDGGDGDDTVRGGGGSDTVLGGIGADSLFGNAGADSLDGGAGNDTLDGGAAADTLTGGDGFDVFIADGTADTITDFNFATGGVLADGDSTNNDFVDLSGFYTALNDLRDDVEDGVLDDAGGLVITGAGRADLTSDNTGVVCFTQGTQITTVTGPKAVERLRIGDQVITADRGPQAVRWISRLRLGVRDLIARPHLSPILIRKNAIAPGRPDRDTRVSPQHRMLVPTGAACAAFDRAELLVAAIKLVNGTTIVQERKAPGVTYVHFLCDRHEIVMSNGTWSESFHPGPNGIATLADPPRAELFDLFPQLAFPGANPPALARDQALGAEARLLAISARYSDPDDD